MIPPDVRPLTALVGPDEPTCTHCQRPLETLFPLPSPPPATIGRYRILRLLGAGGMGMVYEAEQDHPRRKVALKVLKSGLPSPDLLWRFEQEAEVLGRLQHPGIARVYEAGQAETAGGTQPYFALELIHGTPLLAYAQTQQLNTRQRLELMVKISEAVQHAHQLGIIHRDLKPANILVEENGQPKILDFGVARVVDREAQATCQTEVGQIVGTLAYMSPEQVLGDPLGVDTRSDVYALGVILYELLAGRLPYKLSQQLPEAVQTIRDEEPTRLSSVSRTYRGDIETIVGKALEKEKARRYASAAELAVDIERYLKDEPITARPPSTTYQLQKFARRHQGLVAGVAAVFVVLVLGVLASTWEATEARQAEQAALRERDRATVAERATTQQRDRALSAERAATAERNRALTAEAQAVAERNRARAAETQAVQERNRALAEKQRADTEAATAKAVNDFLQNDLLSQASVGRQSRPDTKPDPDLKVRTALDRAAAHITGKFEKQPLVEASIRQTIGNTYKDLGLYPEAQRHLKRALDLQRRVRGEEHPNTLSSMNDLALLYQAQGQYARAEPLFSKVLEVQQRVLGEEHPDTLQSMFCLALLYQAQGQYARAEPLLTKALAGRRRVLGEEHPDTLVGMNNLALLYHAQGQYARAESLLTKFLEVAPRVLGEEHPYTLNSMNGLGVLYRNQGKYAQAESLFIKALETHRRVLGEEHPNTLSSMNNLALLYQAQGQYARAEPLFTKALAGRRRALGEEHPHALLSMENLAVLYRDQGQYARAEPLFTRALEIESRVLGPAHPTMLRHTNDLALLFVNTGRYAQAERRLREALPRYQTARTPTWDQDYCQGLLGASLAGQKRYAEAEPLLLAGYEGMRQRVDTVPAYNRSQLALVGQWIVQLYQDWGQPEKAAEWRAKLQRISF